MFFPSGKDFTLYCTDRHQNRRGTLHVGAAAIIGSFAGRTPTSPKTSQRLADRETRSIALSITCRGKTSKSTAPGNQPKLVESEMRALLPATCRTVVARHQSVPFGSTQNVRLAATFPPKPAEEEFRTQAITLVSSVSSKLEPFNVLLGTGSRAEAAPW